MSWPRSKKGLQGYGCGFFVLFTTLGTAHRTRGDICVSESKNDVEVAVPARRRVEVSAPSAPLPFVPPLLAEPEPAVVDWANIGNR